MNATLATATLLVFILSIGAAAWFVWFRLRMRGLLSHALGLTVLHIKLPPAERQAGSVSDLQEKVAAMEQVYGSLAGMHEGGWHSFLYGKLFVSWELVVPHVGQEVQLLCAVPRRYESQVEKAVTAIYPGVAVERVADYNSFSPTGVAAAALAVADSAVLPLKTYRSLSVDPLASTVNAFSKVAHEGESLVLQVVSTPAGRGSNGVLRRAAEMLRQGVPLRDAINDARRSSVAKVLWPSKHKKAKDQSPGSVNEQLVQQVEGKAQQPLFLANIRLVASATTRERAEALLGDLAVPLSQLANEGVNRLTVKRIPPSRLRRVLYDFVFRLPSSRRAVVLSAAELTSIIHVPDTLQSAARISGLKARLLPPPNGLPSDGVVLGVNTYRGVDTPICMAADDRARHLYVIGQTGTGKTSFLRNLIVQDIKRGEGVCYIDPHGEAAEAILECIPPERAQDVVYFNPGDIERPMGMNMLEYDQAYPEQKTFIINELINIFSKLYDLRATGGPMFEQYFRNAAGLVMEDPASGCTLLEINRVLVDPTFRAMKLRQSRNPLINAFWNDVAAKAGGEASLQNIVPYISSKFDSFLSNEIMRPIVTQERSAFKLRDLMDSRKILIVNLSKGRLGELNSSLIGLIMVGKILMAALSRTDAPEGQRPPFYLYIDEFQNVTTPSIESILSEARKYQLCLTVAHQFIAQLTPEIAAAVFGNVGSVVAFRVGAEDAEQLAKQLAPEVTVHDLVNLDNHHAYVRTLVHGRTVPAFSMHTVPPDKGSGAMASAVKQMSSLRYGRPRAEVEAEVMGKLGHRQS